MPSPGHCRGLPVAGNRLANGGMLVGLLLLILSGCSRQHKPAPVEDRSWHQAASSGTSRKAQARQKKKSRIILGPSYGASTRQHVIVRRGETLYSICFRENLDLQQVARLNHLKPPYTIYPGQKLLLRKPDSGTKTSGSGKKRKPVKTIASKKPARADVVVRSATKKKSSTGSSGKTTGPAHRVSAGRKPTGTSGRPGKKGAGGIPAKKPAKAVVLKNPSKWIWPASGHLISSYSPSDPARKGIVIAGKPGDPVKAAADGVVVYTGNALKAYGQLIIIKHSDTYLSAYGYNRRSLVREGQAVKQGQKIAEMGASPAGKPGLRFEIRKNGQPVNPLSRLPKR